MSNDIITVKHHYEFEGFAFMKNSKAVFFIAAGAIVLVVFAGILFGRTGLPVFNDYDNNAVLGAASVPSFTKYQEQNFVGGSLKNNRLFTADGLKLSGVEDVVRVEASESTTAKLKFDYQSLKGSFKLILVSDGGKVVSLFDSDRQKSGDTITVPFSKGTDTIRLVGKPAQLQSLSATWVEIDRSGLTESA